MSDPRHYEVQWEETAASFIAQKAHLFQKYLPEKVTRRARYDESHLQYAYVNYKNKCHSEQGGLVCRKNHVHDRKIVSDVFNPRRSFLKLVARTIRIVKMYSKEVAWTIWRQANLKEVIVQRTRQLATLEDFKFRCPCVREKHRTLEVVKPDAAQFFKAASVPRRVKRVRSLVTRVQNRTGNDAVAIYRLPHVKGHLCSDRKHPSSHIQIVSFDNIRRALRLSEGDDRFMVGSCVVKRKGGWPMGASLSEPCTMCDLNHCVWRCSTSTEHLIRACWTSRGISLPFPKIVAGVLNVDDMPVFSNIWCQHCIAKFTKRMFPGDIGLDVEEQGPT